MTTGLQIWCSPSWANHAADMTKLLLQTPKLSKQTNKQFGNETCKHGSFLPNIPEVY